ncbi:uridine kinase [Haloferula sp. A504]|uniref:uridine kinase n=1 Tax=Haloferula sp. A504 TaxID=3373601 RepID=UPI0031C88947|nr:zeta toxin family protein [Verrucomicrobiaceae bacterium E54]
MDGGLGGCYARAAVTESASRCAGVTAALPLLLKAQQSLQRPVLVGIGGPGGSGKSTFAQALAAELEHAGVLPLDDYRKSRTERGRGIYGSHPEGNRIDLLKSHLEAAREGHPIERPVFCRERGAAHETETLEAPRFLIADGEISTHRGVREHFDLRILILAGWRLQWQARIGRDRRERSTSFGKALSLFWTSNLRDYPRFSVGAHEQADLVLRRSNCGRRLHLHG